MKETIPGYRTEIALRKTILLGKDEVTIQGRADGLRPDGTYDEIKSTYRPGSLVRKLQSDPRHPYWLQLACYRWMSAESRDAPEEIPDRLIVVDARSLESETLDARHWTPDDFESWLVKRLEAIIKREGERRAFVKRQKKLAGLLAFPFTEVRSGQQGFMDEINATCSAKGRLLGQAPTGIGKSLGSLFPALKYALEGGTKVAFLTPKNSQFTVAENAAQQLAKSVPLRSITLGAKAKLCLNDEVNCAPEACPYAKGHYDKVADAGLLRKLSRRAVLTPQSIKAIAKKHQVCPYTLSMQLIPRRDVLVSDYNHAFSPESNLRAKMAGADLEAPRPVVLVDEAHNLPDRARDHWSGSLKVADAEGTRWHRTLKKILETGARAYPDPDKLNRLAMKILDAILDESAGSAEKTRERTNLDLELFFAVRRFTALLSASIERDHFFLRNPQPGTWEVHCLDAAAYIAEKFDEFSSVIAFSATLKPLDFYRNELGLTRPADKAIEWASPFDAVNQKTILIPQVSTLWREREQNYGKIASAIQRIVAMKTGHYMAFFPSFAFLDQVAARLSPGDIEILTQVPGQFPRDTAAMLERFRDPLPGKTLLMLAVQGGTFAEGIDLPGDQLIGAFIVGPGLPAVTPVREKMREYFEKKYGAGFDYAYTYPAMAKSVQAAGRVIRTGDDRGIVVLMDRRFSDVASMASLPAHWIDHIHEARPGESLAGHINDFWT
ncbi:ATP-dependent DNA helicase [bacterium]|nr:ATP-dependent DNA helicase [bacterium]